MRKLTSRVVSALIIAAATVSVAEGPANVPAHFLIPNSSMERREDAGVRAHTNHLVRLDSATADPAGRATSSSTLPKGETPASLRAVYNLPSTGGSGTIAIVDAYHYATAENDLAVFSKQFSLPPCTTASGCFRVVYASGRRPAVNCGWNQEAALDIEWAHAMAPNAKIVLVEAASSTFYDLMRAVDVATSVVTTGGGKGEVSMSWGGSEFRTESSYDSHFQNTNAVYFAASGDSGGVNQYPSTSPYVISTGGTTINRDSTGAFISETGWSGSGGGPSRYETKLFYQNSVAGTDPIYRSAPDLSFNASPSSGVLVYDSTVCNRMSGWMIFAGTSVAAPALTGIVNLAASSSGGSFATNSVAELTRIYTNAGNGGEFRDVTSGTAGKFNAGSGYDFVTGVGSSLGVAGK